MNPDSRPHPRSILIIGGGASGLVSLRNLTTHGDFANVQLVERRDDVGGVWYLQSSGAHAQDHRPQWPSPSYPNMIGNVLPEYLAFSGLPFPPTPDATQPFPTVAETHAYLRTAAQPFLDQGKIRLSTEVVRVEELADGRGWKVVLRDWSPAGAGAGRLIEEQWDAIVVASGRQEGVWPDCPGVDEVRSMGIGVHAMDYRGPAGCDGKRVVVIGNGNSSNDIAAQVVDRARHPVYRSIRRPPLFRFVSLPDPRIIDVPPVERYTVHPTTTGTHTATLHLKDGTQITDVDTIFFGTGYTHSYPFLYVLDPSSSSSNNNTSSSSSRLTRLTCDDVQPSRIPFLYRHTLYAHNPSLAFIGALVCLTPFIMADLCSTFLALAWTRALPYPHTLAQRLLDDAHRTELVRKLRAQSDNPSNFLACHVLGDQEQPFARALRQEIVRVRPDFDHVFHPWTSDEVASRDAMYPLKLESLRRAKERDRAL